MQGGGARQVYRGGTVEEAGGDRQRIGLADGDGAGRARIDGHAVGDERIHLEGGMADGCALWIGQDVDRPHTGRGGERQGDGQIDALVPAAGRDTVEEHLPVRALDEQMGG